MVEMSVGGWMFILVPAHPGCPGQSPESCKMDVCVCACMRACMCAWILDISNGIVKEGCIP